MLDFIVSMASAIYGALNGFAVSVQALAGILPWHASLALSIIVAVVFAVLSWSASRLIRGK